MTTSNKPLKGISKLGEYSNSESYRINCECTSDDHAVDMYIEVSDANGYDLPEGYKVTPEIQVEFFVNTTTPYWKEGNGIHTYSYENSVEAIWRVTKNRIKAAYNILVKGSTPQSHTLALDSEGAKNVAISMIQIIDRLEKEYNEK